MKLHKLRKFFAAAFVFTVIGTCSVTAYAHGGGHHGGHHKTTTYKVCEYEDCELTYKHTHKDGCSYYGHYEGDGHGHDFSNAGHCCH